MWKSWRRQRKTKKIILKEFFSIGQCFVLTKDYGEHYLGNFGLSKSCSHHLKIYIYIYISMDHKTGFKMTLGQNEKFCQPF